MSDLWNERDKDADVSFANRVSGSPNSSSSSWSSFERGFLFGAPHGINMNASDWDSYAAYDLNTTPIQFNRHNVTSSSDGTKSVHWSPSLTSSSHSKISHSLSDEVVKQKPPLRSIREEFSNSAEFILGSPLAHSSEYLKNSSLQASTSNDYTVIHENDCWVTVFGFPPERAMQILDFFSRHGNVADHKSPMDGNWIHIRFANPLHAEQALSRNLQIFEGRMVLGVIPVPPELMHEISRGSPNNGGNTGRRPYELAVANEPFAIQSATASRFNPPLSSGAFENHAANVIYSPYGNNRWMENAFNPGKSFTEIFWNWIQK